MSTLLEIERLSKRFGPIEAVSNVSFTVRRGEIVGFLGPNGAGKSTTMRMVAGFLPPDAGRAAICGHDVAAAPREAKRRLGYLPEGAPLYGDMTPAALLTFVAEVRRLPMAERARKMTDVIDRLQLADALHRPIETLSKGFKRRVGLAQAILHDPEVLILDEPTDGLDPNQKHEVRSLLREVAGDKAIIISTHILEEVETVCSRAIIIARGAIVADALPEDLQARAPDHNAVVLRLAPDQAGEACAVVERLAGVARVGATRRSERSVLVTAWPQDGRDILAAVREAVAGRGIHIEEVHVQPGRLDEVFRALTRAA